MSEDQGQNWQKVASAAPEQGGFHFRAERDGLYFFTVRTVDISGKANPPTVQGVAPQIRVYVDTQLPLVSLRQAPSRSGMVGVEWEIREENLDVNSLSSNTALATARIGSPFLLRVVALDSVTGTRRYRQRRSPTTCARPGKE